MGRDQAAAAVMAPEKLKLFMGVLALQFLLAGFHIVTRAALNSKIVFIVYRNIISLALLAPFAYFLEKCVNRPFLQHNSHSLRSMFLLNLSAWISDHLHDLFQERQATTHLLFAGGIFSASVVWVSETDVPCHLCYFQF
jgi:hypothetical protein